MNSPKNSPKNSPRNSQKNGQKMVKKLQQKKFQKISQKIAPKIGEVHGIQMDFLMLEASDTGEIFKILLLETQARPVSLKKTLIPLR